RRGDAEGQARGRRPQRPRQRAGLERRSGDRAAAGVRADVESAGRGDRHAAGGVAADDDLFCRCDDERQGSGSGEGADQGTDRRARGSYQKGKGPGPRWGGGGAGRPRGMGAGAGLLVPRGAARAAETDARTPTAMKAAVDELAPPFERANGHVLRITYGPSGGLARRLNARRPISSSWTARRSTS